MTLRQTDHEQPFGVDIMADGTPVGLWFAPGIVEQDELDRAFIGAAGLHCLRSLIDDALGGEPMTDLPEPGSPGYPSDRLGQLHDDEGGLHWNLLDFGCSECGYTGLHVDPADIGKPMISVERHDECEALADDVEAAAFIALCHPEYRFIMWSTDGGGVHTMPPIAYDTRATYPPIRFAQPVVLCTNEGYGQAFEELRRR